VPENVVAKHVATWPAPRKLVHPEWESDRL